MVPRVLVQWSHLPLHLSTWEDTATLRQEYRHASTWGQVVSRGGDDATIKGAPTTAMTDGGNGLEARSRRVQKLNPRFTRPKWK